MQTILGSNGIIGTTVAKELPSYTDKIRLVSRNPKKLEGPYEMMPADITDPEQVRIAVKGSEVTYLTVGLQYDIKVWREQWPKIMDNVINACKESGSKLVFFDNVYLYGKVDGWMTEETPVNPCSKKGEVRAKIATKIMEESKAGNIKALISRAADFYGPDSPLSFVNVMVFENFMKNKNPQWMIDADKKHSFSYTPDAGMATALLGNTDSAFNQIWHVPGDQDALTGRDFIAQAAEAFGKDPKKFTVLKEWMLRGIGLFVPVLKESVEMLYQSRYEYLFDSSKFHKTFNKPYIKYSEGIKTTAESMKIKT